jgi:hypothetical protein
MSARQTLLLLVVFRHGEAQIVRAVSFKNLQNVKNGN